MYTILIYVFRFLVTDVNFKQLAIHFMRSASTIGLIVFETCNAIWTILQPICMPVPTEGTWRTIVDRYNSLWNFPHCVGSTDGKHFRVQKFANTSLKNINCKGFFSVQLLACADANGCFTTIDIEDLGRNSDGRVFRSSRLGRWLQREKLNLSESESLPFNDNLSKNSMFFFAEMRHSY